MTDLHSSAATGEPTAAGDAPWHDASPSLAFRDQQPADAAIIRRIHAGHWRVPAGLDLSPALLDRLLDQQHDSQERHVATYYPHAVCRMILADGVAVGRLCLDSSAMPWHLIDLALVENAQGRGIGSAVLRRLCDEAARASIGILLDVGRDNPRAEALYLRAGFVEAGAGNDTHRRLVWTLR